MKKIWLYKIGLAVMVMAILATLLPQAGGLQVTAKAASLSESKTVPVFNPAVHQDCFLNVDGSLRCIGGNHPVEPKAMILPAGNFTQISAGRFHSCALVSGGLSISCWGDAIANNAGAFLTPALPAGLIYKQVGVGIYYTCGLRSNNTVICWGDDSSGVVSATNTSAINTKLSTGYEHSCGLDSLNNIVCWGNSANLRLTAPVGPYDQLSAGGAHSCARRTDSSLVCWGAGTTIGIAPDYGQSIPPAGSFDQVSAGGLHSCALANGAITCWGLNTSGQTTVATLPAGVTYTAVSSGETHTCALRSNGSIVCWGSNSKNERDVPPGNYTYLQVSTGKEYSCGLRQGGSVVCWGANYNTISGSVKSNNIGMSGVTINYTDGSGVAKSVVTDASGYYSFTATTNSSGTVTPYKVGFAFTPSSRTYDSTNPKQTNQDYSAAASATFQDVPTTHVFWRFIEGLYGAGITGGCSVSPRLYCPDGSVTRAQMAIFLLRGMYGKDYVPPAATGAIFTDVPVGAFAANFIEQLYSEGITGGCGTNLYCPNNPVTRAQMAIFLLRSKYGKLYTPPAPSGAIFTDVPTNAFAAAFIEQLYAEGITGGCQVNLYCPSNPVTRAQMAVFLSRTFSLPLP